MGKKKVDINKDIKTIKKEFDSLTSFKEKKDIGEELFAPSATIIQQVKPKYNNKIEKKPQSSSKYNDTFQLGFLKKAKDKAKELKDYLLREELGDGHLSLHAGPAVGLAVVPVV